MSALSGVPRLPHGARRPAPRRLQRGRHHGLLHGRRGGRRAVGERAGVGRGGGQRAPARQQHHAPRVGQARLPGIIEFGPERQKSLTRHVQGDTAP